MALMGGAVLSKLLGVLREIVMAQVLGVTFVADAFRAALTVILLPLSILQNESVPALLVPMYRRWQDEGDSARQFSAMAAALTLIAIALTLVVESMAHVWIRAIVGGFSEKALALALDFTRIMALAMPASALLNCLAAAEIALGRARLMTLRAALLNLSILIGLALIALTGEVRHLAWAFTIGFNGLAGIGIVWFVREGLLSLSGLRPAGVFAAAKTFLRGLRPLLSIPLAEQGSIWIERALASRMTAGTVAAMDYARTLTDSTLLLISQPIGLAVLSRGGKHDRADEVQRIARPVLAITLPASVFLFAFADEVARLVFARGAFDDHAVALSSHALQGIAIGLSAATLGWILLRLLNSSGRNVAAAGILCGAYVANACANLLITTLVVEPDAGSRLLGIGESVRSVVLLVGTALLLGCARQVAGVFAVAMGPAALMAGLAWLIGILFTGLPGRLLCGSTACAASIAIALLLLVPSLRSFRPSAVKVW